jgi:hypothetical protein
VGFVGGFSLRDFTLICGLSIETTVVPGVSRLNGTTLVCGLPAALSFSQDMPPCF